MSRRSRGREVALQLLYQREVNPGLAQQAGSQQPGSQQPVSQQAGSARRTLERFVRDRLKDKVLEPFALALYDGVVANRDDIDRRISAAAHNWKLTRMAVVDRNVLRLGAFEILHTPDTPPAAVIDEAVELVRRFGSADSPAFVNGVLDRLRKTAAAAR